MKFVIVFLFSVASDKFTPILANLNPHVIANLFLVYLDSIPGGLINLESDQDIGNSIFSKFFILTHY